MITVPGRYDTARSLPQLIYVVIPTNNVRNMEVRVCGIKVFVELPHKLVLLLGGDIQYKIWSPKFSRAHYRADRTPVFIHRFLGAVVKEIQMYVLTLTGGS